MRLIWVMVQAEAGFGILFAVFMTAIVYAFLANLTKVALAAILEADVKVRCTVTSLILTVNVHRRRVVQGFAIHPTAQATICCIVPSARRDIANVAVAAGTEGIPLPGLALKVVVTV